MTEHFYKFRGRLNDDLVKLAIQTHKIKHLRNKFLKANGLLKNGMPYYDFTINPKLTSEQLSLLNIPEKELKKNGEPRKDSKTMKNFIEKYHQLLKDNQIDLNNDPDRDFNNEFRDLYKLNGFIHQEFNHSTMVYNDTLYCKGSELKSHKDIKEIKGLEFYEVLEKLRNEYKS